MGARCTSSVQYNYAAVVEGRLPSDKNNPAAIAGVAFLRALAEHGVDFSFANPGTDSPPIIE